MCLDAVPVACRLCSHAGPIAFSNVTLGNGKPFVEGKLLTGFSNDEEVNLGTINACAYCARGVRPRRSRAAHARNAGVFCFLGFEGPDCLPCSGPSMPVSTSAVSLLRARRWSDRRPSVGSRWSTT